MVTNKALHTSILDANGNPFTTSNPLEVSDDDVLVKLTDIETNQTDKTQYTHITDGTEDVDVDVDNNLAVAVYNNGLSISQGKVTNISKDHKFGNAPDFDTGDNEVNIYDGADDGGINQMVYQWSTFADIDTISSSNAGDTQTIELFGLDVNYEQATQTVTLNGQTAVTLVTPLVAIFRMKNTQNNDDLLGTLYCYVSTAISSGVPTDSTKVRAIISIGNGQTEMALTQVPVGCKLYIREVNAYTAGASRTTNYIIKLYVDPFGQSKQLKFRASVNDDTPLDRTYADPSGAFREGDKVYMTAQITAGGVTGASVSGGFDYVLEKNTNIWQIESFEYTGLTFPLSPSTGPRGIYFNTDGTKYYVCDSINDRVYEYDMAQAWNIASSAYNSVFEDVSAQAASPRDLFFNDVGTIMYIADNTTTSIFQYTLSTPWDLSTSAYASKSVDISSYCGTPEGIFLSDDGTRLFVVCNTGDVVISFTLGTPWDISTAVYDNKSLSIASGENKCISFKADGTIMYILDDTNNTIFQWNLSTAWDIDTAVYENENLIMTDVSNPRGMFFRQDGQFFAVVDTDDDAVHQYRLN